MNFILSIIRTLYRHRWFLLICTSIVTLSLYYYTRHMHGDYDVRTTLYTGVASGYNLENGQNTDWSLVQNSMDNLISIIQAESTLKKVCLRLFARVMMKGDPNKDQNGITASSYRSTYEHVANSPHGKEILALIDRKSEDKTVQNLENYMKPEITNYVYGLFYYNHPFYSANSLKKIQVQRRLTSDLLDISYSSGDPGIAYNTISILMDEFVIEYQRIRYGETNKVIEYFKSELERIGDKLHVEEDDLTKYNVEKRIINYLDETKEIAAINKEFELREQDVLYAYNSSKAMLSELEKHMDSNAKQVITNLQFVDKLREASNLTGKISEVESTSSETKNNNGSLDSDKKRLTGLREELNNLTDKYIGHKYTKEGASRTNIINQWLDQTLLYEKAKSELQVIQQARQDLNDRYVFYAPVGTTIKQKERSINFTESNYLTILQSYNEALLRKKNLEMTSATIKVLNEPMYPISSNPTNRKVIVIGACIGTLLALISILILIELLDKTLRDTSRAQRVTKLPIIGVLPSNISIYGAFNPKYLRAATQKLSNVIFRFLTQRKDTGTYIINLLSTCDHQNVQHAAENVTTYMQERQLKVKYISYRNDFKIDSSYTLARSVLDFYTPQGEDIILVEYPPLDETNVPEGLLKNANINIIVASAKHGWKSTDKIQTNIVRSEVGEIPLFLCLTGASRLATEDFTGLLPPYTFGRILLYRFGQLALTERFHFLWNKKKKDIAENEEDDE